MGGARKGTRGAVDPSPSSAQRTFKNQVSSKFPAMSSIPARTLFHPPNPFSDKVSSTSSRMMNKTQRRCPASVGCLCMMSIDPDACTTWPQTSLTSGSERCSLNRDSWLCCHSFARLLLLLRCLPCPVRQYQYTEDCTPAENPVSTLCPHARALTIPHQREQSLRIPRSPSRQVHDAVRSIFSHDVRC